MKYVLSVLYMALFMILISGSAIADSCSGKKKSSEARNVYEYAVLQSESWHQPWGPELKKQCLLQEFPEINLKELREFFDAVKKELVDAGFIEKISDVRNCEVAISLVDLYEEDLLCVMPGKLEVEDLVEVVFEDMATGN